MLSTTVVSYYKTLLTSSKASSSNKPDNRNGLPTTCLIPVAKVTLCNCMEFLNSHHVADWQLFGGKTNWAIQSLIPLISFFLECGYNVETKFKENKNSTSSIDVKV